MNPADLPELRLKPGEELRLLTGHSWIYDNELKASSDPGLAPGALVRVVTARGEVAGCGLYSPTSRIRVRLLSHGNAALPGDWLARRLAQAVAARQELVSQTEMYRLVHGEADGLPGLVADRYGAFLVLQISAQGFAVRAAEVAQRLADLTGAQGVLQVRDSVHRRHEGLPIGEPELLRGQAPPPGLLLREGDLTYAVDVAAGPKGGFFLDQRTNRLRLRSYVRPGDRVLDLFCGSGGFGLAALRAGAQDALLVDGGQETLRRVAETAARNGLTVRTERADLFEVLPRWAEDGHGGPYDLVILDPPGLTRGRGREAVVQARRASRKINEAALRLVRPGGLLFTCSCSQLLSRESFLELLGEAARRTVRQVRLLEASGAAADHPVRPGMPETEYLKAFFLQVD